MCQIVEPNWVTQPRCWRGFIVSCGRSSVLGARNEDNWGIPAPLKKPVRVATTVRTKSWSTSECADLALFTAAPLRTADVRASRGRKAQRLVEGRQRKFGLPARLTENAAEQLIPKRWPSLETPLSHPPFPRDTDRTAPDHGACFYRPRLAPIATALPRRR